MKGPSQSEYMEPPEGPISSGIIADVVQKSFWRPSNVIERSKRRLHVGAGEKASEAWFAVFRPALMLWKEVFEILGPWCFLQVLAYVFVVSKSQQ